MKNILIAFVALAIFACEGDYLNKPSFLSVASITKEVDEEVLIIPFKNVYPYMMNDLALDFASTAVEGEDFEILKITSDGVKLKIFNNNIYSSPDKQLRIELILNNAINRFHTLTIIEDPEDCIYIKERDMVGKKDRYFDIDLDLTLLEPYASEVVILEGEDGGLKMMGLGINYLIKKWKETVDEMDTLDIIFTDDENFVIPKQVSLQTSWKGIQQLPSQIVGTGTVDRCGKTITLKYELIREKVIGGKLITARYAYNHHLRSELLEEVFTAILEID